MFSVAPVAPRLWWHGIYMLLCISRLPFITSSVGTLSSHMTKFITFETSVMVMANCFRSQLWFCQIIIICGIVGCSDDYDCTSMVIYQFFFKVYQGFVLFGMVSVCIFYNHFVS